MFDFTANKIQPAPITPSAYMINFGSADRENKRPNYDSDNGRYGVEKHVIRETFIFHLAMIQQQSHPCPRTAR
jgi:hypothetical protein